MKCSYKITKQGLTLNGNEVVEATKIYDGGYTEKIIVFYKSEERILSAQRGELWFDPEPTLSNFLVERSAKDVFLHAISWATETLSSVDNEDLLWEIKYLLRLSDKKLSEDNARSYIEDEAIEQAKKSMRLNVDKLWASFPRVDNPKSRDLPLPVPEGLLPCTIACKFDRDRKIIYFKIEVAGYFYGPVIRVKEVESPTFPTYRGWYEEGRGYSGGHVSQSDYPTTEPTPNPNSSYYYDTTRVGNTQGYYPSMLSF